MVSTNLKLTVLPFVAIATLSMGGESSDDKKAIVGTWTVTYAFVDGMKVPAEELMVAEVIISDGKMIMREKGKAGEVDPWVFQLDATKKPKTIDVRLTKLKLRPGGGAVGKVSEKLIGIYDLKGNELRIALSNGVPIKKNAKDQAEADKSVKRPKSFEHGPDVANIVILKRVDK